MVRVDVPQLSSCDKTDANICILYVREGWACLVVYLNAFVRCHSCSYPIRVC